MKKMKIFGGFLGVGLVVGLVYAFQKSKPRKLAHVGDSLTAYTTASLKAAYEAQGFEPVIDAGGGRAILQKLPKDSHTGIDAVRAIKSQGFQGDWVIALGTNDTANVSVGSSYTRDSAIDSMMNAIDSKKKTRVMWVNTRTATSSGAWANSNMTLWNLALERAKARWPNLVVYDWSSESSIARPPYSDGIHHTPQGYEVRNVAIARAAKRTFG